MFDEVFKKALTDLIDFLQGKSTKRDAVKAVLQLLNTAIDFFWKPGMVLDCPSDCSLTEDEAIAQLKVMVDEKVIMGLPTWLLPFLIQLLSKLMK